MAATAAPPTYQIRLSGTPPHPSAATNGGSNQGKGGGGRNKNKKKKDSAQPQQRHTVTVTPTLTLPRLKLDASRLFGVGLEYDVEFLVGYPPKPIDDSAAASAEAAGGGDGEGTLVKDLVGRNESVIVRFVAAAAAAGAGAEKNGGGAKGSGAGKTTNGKKGGKKRARPVAAAASAGGGDSSDEYDNDDDDADAGAATAAPSGSSSSRRSKRAASAAATASMPALVKAQNELMAATTGGGKPAKKRSAAAAKKSASSPNAAAKKKAAAEARAAAAASRRLAALPGRRLADGAAVGPPPSSASSSRTGISSKSKKKSVFGTMSSEDDVSYQLMGSLDGGGGGKVGKVLRSAMRNAVGKTYEASRAVVRVDSVRSGKFSIAPSNSTDADTSRGGRLGGESSQFTGVHTARYSKGVEGRGEYEEEVEIIGLEALKAVVRAVHADHPSADSTATAEAAAASGGGGGGREMLRPASMAQLSPRVFWSLAHHYPGLDTESALREMLPDLDWTLLDGRSRVLSEKARENLRQDLVARGELPGDDGDASNGAVGDGAAGIGAVEAVERAMMDEGAGNDRESAREARERAARAAMARFGGGVASSPSAASSAAAVGAQRTEDEPEWQLVTPTEVDEDELAECIQAGTSELDPDAAPTGPEVESWVATLMERCSIRNWRELANSSAPIVLAGFAGAPTATTASASTSVPTESQVESILDAARLRSIDEIMLSILDSPNYNAEDVFVVLRDEARCGTPKDLACWGPIPGMLLEEAEGLVEAGVGVEDVRRWCGRTGDVLEFWLWLDWYVTPVA